MNNYKKFTMWFFGLELFLIAIANGLYYMTANNQKTDIERLQDKTDTIYKIIYMQTDYRTWILMNISLGILFLLSVFLVLSIGAKVIKPFQEMQYLADELAKGNLSMPIKA